MTSPKLPNFEFGDQIIINKDNADAWAPIIGRPLVDNIKNTKPEAAKPNFVVTCVDRHKGIITIGRIKETK